MRRLKLPLDGAPDDRFVHPLFPGIAAAEVCPAIRPSFQSTVRPGRAATESET